MNQHLSQSSLSKIKKHLQEELLRIQSRTQELSGQDPFTDPDRANDNAATDLEASEESNHDRVAAIIDELKTQQAKIEKALERIEQGTYGLCEVCAEAIDADRLSVVPTATLCLTHEKAQAAKPPKV